MRPELIYIGDPMCSWCFGFAPVIQALYAKHRDAVTMTLRMGGLHVGNDYVVEADYREFLRAHWLEIGERTGQKFSLDILDRPAWIYDTELACRAVVAVRRLKPGAEWAYFPLIQAGFYTHNRDPHDPLSFALAAEEIGISRSDFLAAYDDPERGYVSRARPMFQLRYESPYDHLARVLEWSAGSDGKDGGEGE